jgi:hypothetical protein
MPEGDRDMIINETEGVLKELSPLIRCEDLVEARRLAQESELAAVVQYLKSNIPEVNEYLSSVPEDASDAAKINAIKRGLKTRAEGLVPSYSMPAPFLGNEVEEARSKRNSPYKGYVVSPYIETPKTSKVRRNPIKRSKAAGLKFL